MLVFLVKAAGLCRAAIIVFSLVAASAGLVSASCALAQSEFASAGDRSLTMLSGSAVGGGYDASARVIARHLPAQMPGKVTFVVQNMSGGGIHAGNTLYNIPPRDGSVIALLQRGILPAPLLNPKQANFQYEPRRFSCSRASA